MIITPRMYCALKRQSECIKGKITIDKRFIDYLNEQISGLKLTQSDFIEQCTNAFDKYVETNKIIKQ